MLQNINTILVDMPSRIRAYTVANKDLSYTIVINSRLNHETQMKAYQHELNHIQNGDYEKKCSSDLIEFFAHH